MRSVTHPLRLFTLPPRSLFASPSYTDVLAESYTSRNTLKRMFALTAKVSTSPAEEAQAK